MCAYDAVVNTINPQTLVALCVLGFIPGHARCEDRADVDHSLVFEVGPAAERDLKSKSSNYGATVAIETTPIEHVLELEFGITLLNTAGRTELGADVLFKRPFRLSQTAELMIGLGPTVAQRFHNNEHGTSVGMEFVLDFMFWPTKNVGWYLEPSYGFGLGSTRGERSIGGSAGILIGWP
jgi:hypothetical protein